VGDEALDVVVVDFDELPDPDEAEVDELADFTLGLVGDALEEALAPLAAPALVDFSGCLAPQYGQ
jgi:hypothetical protein